MKQHFVRIVIVVFCLVVIIGGFSLLFPNQQAQAQVSYVGIGTGSTSSSQLSIQKPANTAAGDIMIAQIALRSSSTTITPPSGWTLIRRDTSNSRITSAVYYKFVTTSEPSSYSWSLGGSFLASGGIVAYRGVNTSTPIGVTSARLNGTACTITADSITTTKANEMLVFIGANDDSNPLTPPSNMTERVDIQTNDASTYIADQLLSAAGATGSKQTGCSSSSFISVGQMISLSPATTPTNTPIPALNPTLTPILTPTVTPTPVSGLGCTTVGNDYVLITDRSGSMDDENRMNLAKTAAKNFIDEIAQDSGSRVALVSFESVGDETTDLDFTTNFTQAKNIIDSYDPNGLTCTRCGLTLARQQFTDNGRANAKFITVLLTDGEPWHSDSWYDTQEDEKEVKNVIALGKTLWDEDKIQIYAIGLGTAKFEDFLPDLVSYSNGISYQARYGSELEPIYNAIFTDVQPRGAVSGTVYNDANRNGANNSEPRLAGWQVVLNNGSSNVIQTTDSNGNYSFNNICDGVHRASLTIQTNWIATAPLNPNYYTITVQNGAATINQNFGIAQGYTISGNVFLDTNKNGLKDSGEPTYSGKPNLVATRNGIPVGTMTTSSDGTYQINGLSPGTVTVSYTSLPQDYILTYPLNGPPPSFQVTVGPGCDTNGSKGSSCQ